MINPPKLDLEDSELLATKQKKVTIVTTDNNQNELEKKNPPPNWTKNQLAAFCFVMVSDDYFVPSAFQAKKNRKQLTPADWQVFHIKQIVN